MELRNVISYPCMEYPRIICGILAIPQNIVTDLSNVILESMENMENNPNNTHIPWVKMESLERERGATMTKCVSATLSTWISFHLIPSPKGAQTVGKLHRVNS